MGFTLFYLCLIVLVPLLTLPARDGVDRRGTRSGQTITDPRVVASYRLSIGASLVAALVNAVFGLLVAWVLVRYAFPGPADRRRADRSAVRAADRGRRHHADDALRAERLARPARSSRYGIKVAFTPLGITHRADLHRPAVRRADAAAGDRGSRRRGRGGGDEPRRDPLRRPDAASSCRISIPAWLTGFALSFARAVGEYGSVVFISGNMPMRTEISPLLIITKLEQFDYAGATAIALVMLLMSFALLLSINAPAGLERRGGWRTDGARGWIRSRASRAHRPPPCRRHLTEPPLVRWVLIAVALAFLVAVPGAAAGRRCSSRRSPTGSAPYLDGDPRARRAGRAAADAARRGDRRARQPGVRRLRRLGDREVRLSAARTC